MSDSATSSPTATASTSRPVSAAAALRDNLRSQIATLLQPPAAVATASRKAQADLLRGVVAQTVQTLQAVDPLERDAIALLSGKRGDPSTATVSATPTRGSGGPAAAER